MDASILNEPSDPTPLASPPPGPGRAGARGWTSCSEGLEDSSPSWDSSGWLDESSFMPRSDPHPMIHRPLGGAHAAYHPVPQTSQNNHLLKPRALNFTQQSSQPPAFRAVGQRSARCASSPIQKETAERVCWRMGGHPCLSLELEPPFTQPPESFTDSLPTYVVSAASVIPQDAPIGAVFARGLGVGPGANPSARADPCLSISAPESQWHAPLDGAKPRPWSPSSASEESRAPWSPSSASEGKRPSGTPQSQSDYDFGLKALRIMTNHLSALDAEGVHPEQRAALIGEIDTLKSQFCSPALVRATARHRRFAMTPEARQIFEDWLQENKHPYPTAKQKAVLARQTQLSSRQVNDWFTNYRKRHWQKLHTDEGGDKPERAGYLESAADMESSSMEKDCYV